MDFDKRFSLFFQKSIHQIEIELGLGQGYLRKLREGETNNPQKLIFALQKRGLNPDYFLTGEGSPELASPAQLVPLLEQKASAGFGAELTGDDIRALIELPKKAQGKGLVALAVQGDSMAPTFHDGDIAICDTAGWSGDGVYIIKTQDYLYIKRVIHTSDGFQVISDNPQYPPYKAEETAIIGRVKAALHVW